MAHYAVACGLRCAVRRIHGHWLNGREIRDMRKFLTPLTDSVEQISSTDTTELVPLTDAELDAVAGGLLNNNSNNTGVGAIQGGTNNINVALADIGIGNISVL